MGISSRRPLRLIRRTGFTNDTRLWGRRPLLLVGTRTAGARIASSPDSDLEAFSHNPTHGSFAPLAFQPSAMTNFGFPLSVPVLSRLFDARGRDPEGPVPSSSPGRHAATRSRRGSSSSSPPTADGFGAGTPVPSPQSQSFSRGYGSILPTSLAYIVPSTRGCSPWRPDEVMSTTGRGRHSVLRIFKGRQGRTGHHETCGALPAAGPYLWLSRFQCGQAVKQKRELFPRPPPTSPDSLTLPSAAASRFRNFNPITFRSTRAARYQTGFPRLLGSTNPCASAICTDGRYARARAPGFAATAAPSYSSGPGTCPDARVSAQFGTVIRLPVHPASPVLLTKNVPLGALDSVARLNKAAAPSYLFKVCSHSNPSQKIKVGRRCSPLRDPANQLLCALRVYSPVDSHTCLTPWSVFQDGPNGEPAGRRQERAGAEARQTARAAIHNRDDDVSTGISTAWAWAAAVICIALDGIYRPIGAAFPNNPTRRQHLVCDRVRARRGSHPLRRPLPGDLGPGQPTQGRSRGIFSSTVERGDCPAQAPFSAIRNARITGGQIPPKHLVAPDQSGGGRGLGLRCVTPRQTCPRPSGFGRNFRSKTRWFTGFCNSHQVSHFATFFIDARAEISVAESHF
ncbi:senescence-associated protein [Senna tora]|uniref:Senescence-associated protein n=1 Tax=Senna tora TaxID=362788 RepID=A0A834SRF3_9FABA|nr:senescence-associated protein [Senna tora]